MSAAVAAGLVLLEIDPNIVRPGWTPLLILLALMGAVVLLYLSLRKQLGKINVPDDPTGEAPSDPTSAPGPGSGTSSPTSG